MKIKMLIPIALILCLAFSLCACGNEAKTDATTTAPATSVATTAANTEATTTAPAETKAETETSADTAEFTEEDALELVKSTYDFSDEYFFYVRGTEEIDGVNYYAVDLRKSLEVNTTYISTYFVTTDGSEIVEGYYAGGEAFLSEKETLSFTEEDAIAMVEGEYPCSDSYYYHVREISEIDGETYYGVDLMRNLEDHSTYISTYFVKTDGSEIVKGSYLGGEPSFSDGDVKPSFEINEENAIKVVNAAYDFDENEYLVLRGIEEIDGVNYYAVDLRKSFNDHSTYLSTFFVNEDGTKIVEGYYMGGVPYLAE